jgi:hypothetical protein
MTESLYTARASIVKVEGVHRAVTLETGQVFDVGVHGAIKEHYKLDRETDRPLPVDYLVGAAGA